MCVIILIRNHTRNFKRNLYAGDNCSVNRHGIRAGAKVKAFGAALVLSIFVVFSANFVQAETLEASSELSRKAFLDPELKKQLALADALKAHETVWLDVSYPDVDAPRKVLAIARASLIAEKQGAVLLLHDKEQHANWPEMIQPLSTRLPKYGWMTLALSLPDELRVQLPDRELPPKSFDQIELNDTLKNALASGARKKASIQDATTPPDEDGSEQSAADATQEIPEDITTEQEEGVDINLAAPVEKPQPAIPYKVRAMAHLTQAVNYLRNENHQTIILLAYGDSAELALQFIKERQAELSSPGFGLIMLEPKLPENYSRDMSEWFGSNFRPAVLDVVDTASRQGEAQAELRKLAFARAGVVNFRQIHVPVSSTEAFNDSFARRIRSWLESTSGMNPAR
jgi:hypothetical protein